ncbi:DUF4974 domain-containing protein [Sabulilitoribacter arenilitoris]|uniref:DUF4974 domain-containing protein n=1 Tax=Wocania arenilitoris TaxID=2044858 RepID=A0AAE3ELT8_9FLAO|nr:FecR family protein [Wocania arenilitoris]MCF7567766.1 DUF4974 domain-containing protein [Wocania arenilitoris]
MINKNTEKLIIKFLNRSLNSKDLDYLKEWILNPKNESLFEDYVRSHYEITIGMNEPDVEDIKEKLFNEIRKNKSLIYIIKSNPFYRLGAAALIALLFSLPFIVKISTNDIENTTVVVQENIKPGTDKATLTLEDGSTVLLEKGNTFKTQNVSSNGEEIVYKEKKQKTEEIVYNYLTIPRGGEYFIKLADGTQVWLNSESQLKYPVNFVEGKTRRVELVYGEAYFDVSPSTQHKGAKFMVFNQSQEVEVLGTEFNIKAYKEESNIYTTLIEGKVEVSSLGIKQNLIPNQQSILDIETNEVKITEVNVNSETSWRKGIFSFKGKPLKDIMKVISRWYDVDVVFMNKELESVEFLGVIDKTQSIERVLSIMKSASINNYKINNKTLILE